ncbi:glycosyltransferase [Paramagnetospirillum kuznetsovii]|uniref:Glycosyltransferase n=1 Tax=Paramagnetospirillum kuznetsovii TaxID=2053833 RepID=A0A364NY99_9PROT|nr:glycosyltransferase family 2 protein [Paramagnetospirillum kuznetsovii]RAU21887.1 glycosyltransferase [Paramagnetospirillum kuznetsovii]
MSQDAVSIILSFRNEEDNLPELIRRLALMADGRPEGFEFIFVNDCSTDRSRQILVEARAKDPRVKIITTARRAGPSEGVLAGLAAATGDAMIYMDCDLQDPPELLPTLIEHWRAGHDVVHTRRSVRHGEDPLRMWLTRRAYEVINWTSRGQMPIESGDFKLLSRRAAQHMLSLREHDPYIRGLAVWMGFDQTFVDYERQPRHCGESKFSGLHRNAVKTMVAGVTSFSFLPIYMVNWAGLCGLALSVLLLLIGLFAGSGWLFASLAFFLWGSLMLAVGATGLYVIRVYKDVRGRPRWIIAEAEGVALVPDRAVMGP